MGGADEAERCDAVRRWNGRTDASALRASLNGRTLKAHRSSFGVPLSFHRSTVLPLHPSGLYHLVMEPTPSSNALPRTLGLWSAVAVVIGITIGSGIFRSPAGVAQKVGDPTLFMALWVVGVALALAGALSLAELAAAFPQSGGYYAYLRES